MKKIFCTCILLTIICGCTMAQLRVWRNVGVKGEEIVSHPLVDASPLAPFAGLLGGLFLIVRNIADAKIKQKGGDSKVEADTRNILSKIAGSKKYLVATIVSAILIAVVKAYEIGIDPALITKIVAGLFGTAIVMNGVEDAALKLGQK